MKKSTFLHSFINLFFTLTAFLCLGTGNVWGDELTVANGSGTSYYAPIYGYYCDQYVRSQIIYPASMLTSMNGQNITAMTFYLPTPSGNALTSNFEIRLKELASSTTTVTSWVDVSSDASLVYSGTLPANTSTLVITFDDAYTYNGGSLLFDLQSTTTGSYAPKSYGNYTCVFTTAAGDYATIYGYNSNRASITANSMDKRPKTTFTYEAASGCKKPKSLTKGAVTNNSASFTWTAGDSETSWQWVCLPAADELSWTGATTVTSASATVSDLTEKTNYKFYVRADCGSEQSSDVNLAFTTKCDPIATYTCGFETTEGITNGSYPTCWEKISSNDYPQVYNYNSKNGSQCLRFYQAGPQYAVLPPFNQDVKNLEISFWYRNGSYSETIEVGYMTDPEDASTFVSLTTGGSALPYISDYGSSITEVNLSGAAVGAKYIAFKYTASSNWASSYIDDITVSVASSCAKPSAPSATSTVCNEAVVSWTNGGEETAWNVRYSTDGETWTTKAATTNPYTLTGLSEQTTYYIQVQANCGGSLSSWSTTTAEVTTPCAAQTGVGYTCDFSSPTYSYGNYVLPNCWQKIASGNYPYIYNYYGRSGQDLYFYGGITGSSEQIAILPPFSENTSELAIKLYYNNSSYNGNSYGSLQVGYMTNPKDASTFTAVETLAKVNSYTLANVPLTGAPDNAYIALRYTGGSSSGALYVDDIEIIEAPSCLAPTGVSGSATAYNQASISWTSDASEWKLQYSADNGENWTDANSGNSITANPYTLNGLEGNSSYVVRVKAVCGEDESDWSANSAAFPTPCAPADASDYSETFESAATGSGKLPDCWDYIQSYVYYGTTIYPYVYGSNAYAGSKALYLYGGVTGTSEQIVRLPELDEDINTLTIEFYYKASESSYSIYAKPIVGFIQADGTTFVAIETLDYAASYTKYKKALSAADADAKYIAIKYAGGASSAGSAYIDNVRVYPTPTCVEPTAVTVDEDDVTATTAIVSWTENNGKSAWKLQYRTESGSWGDAINVTTNPYTLEGLTPNTIYYARVASDCGGGDESAWSEESNDFHTDCATISSFPWNENFESQTADAVPTCWDNSASTASGSIHHKWGVYSYGGNKMIRMNNYNVGQTNGTAILISQKIAIPNDGKEYQLTFDYTNNSSAGAFTVKISKDAGANWADADSYATGSGTSYTNPGEFTKATISLADYAGETINLQFYSLANYGDGAVFVDNLKIDEAPSCANPTALEVDEASIGTETATATWTAGGSETAWTLQYKTAAVEWTDPSVVEETVNTTPSYDFTGLTENTAYTVRVKADCGSGNESEWVELAQPFRTDCANKTVTELVAWTENFESQESGKIPTCWSEVSSYAISAYTQVNASAAKDGSLGVQVYVYSTYTEIALLPTFTEEIKNLKISFDYKNYGTGSNYAALEVGYYNGGEFTNVTTLDKTTSFVASGEIEMPKTAPEGARIAFRVVGKKSGYNGSAYIDNISVIRKPACAVPTITAANATSDGAVVTWTPGDEENQWNLRYSVKDADTWTVLENKTSGFALTGLSVGTTYEVQVQAYCDELHQSAWSASTEFEPVCNAPSALAVTARTQNSATFSWNSSETAWVLQYSTDGENWESENVATNPFTLEGLTAGQAYQAKIQAACGSDFSNVVEFKTWCDVKDAAELPLEINSFTAVPECWEINFVGEYSGIANNKIYFYGNAEQIAVLPAYDIELNKLSVTFGYSTTASLEFGYLDEPNGAFHAFASQPASGEELNLENEAAAVKYIAVRYTSTSAYASGSITSVQLRKTPTCLAPTAVEATPGVGSASISWTNGGSEEAWNLQYKLASVASWDGAAQVAVSAKPFELSGLEQGVSYKVRVQAACAGEDPSDWSDEASFITDCEGIAALPWYADFSVALSACWTIHAQDEVYYKPAANTAMNQLKMDGGKNGNSNNVVVLPAFSADLSDAVLSLEYKNGSAGANYAKLEIGYVTDKNDASTFVIIGEAWEQSTSFTEARVALADVTTGRQIAFRFAGASAISDMSIKNLRVINAYNFADNVDNSGTLAALNGQTVDVTIGRSFLCADYFNTICLPFSLSAEELAASPIASNDLWAFKYARVEGGELLIRIVEAESINAGEPYLISWPTGDNIENPLFKNVTISASAGKTMGNENLKFVGTLKPETFAAHDDSKLFLYQNNTLYWWDGDVASSLKSFRAFFTVEDGAGEMPIKHLPARLIKHEETTTGVGAVQNGNVHCTKVLENNQVVIIRNGVKYSIQGQVIEK